MNFGHIRPDKTQRITYGVVCYHKWWCATQFFIGKGCDCYPDAEQVTDETEIYRRLAVIGMMRGIGDAYHAWTCNRKSARSGARCWELRGAVWFHKDNCFFKDEHGEWTEPRTEDKGDQ